MWVGKKGPVKRGAKNHDQHQYFTAGHSSTERVAIAITVLWHSLTSLQASYSFSTPSAQAIFFSSYVSPTLIALLFHYTTLYITHAPFLSCFSTQNSTSPTLYFSPVSVQNIVHPPSSTSLLFQYTTRYIIPALFLSCFSIQHCIPPILYICPVSVQNTVYGQCFISLPFPYISLYITPSQFLPYSVHKTVYYPPSLSILLQYTTLFVTHALYHSCFST